MTSQQLKETLENATSLLITNKQVVNDDMISTARDLLQTLRNIMSDQQFHFQGKLVLSSEKQNLFNIVDKLEKVLTTEEKLIGETGNKLISVLTNLQNRPFILGLLSKFI